MKFRVYLSLFSEFDGNRYYHISRIDGNKYYLTNGRSLVRNNKIFLEFLNHLSVNGYTLFSYIY
jgi:hypothetical protein